LLIVLRANGWFQRQGGQARLLRKPEPLPAKPPRTTRAKPLSAATPHDGAAIIFLGKTAAQPSELHSTQN